MKKIFLLTALFLQFTFVFGQTPMAEDEKVIQYSTKWGAWVTAAGDNNILFSAKLNFYDKQKRLYSWSVRKKVLKMPIAFEWKITNQVFTDAADRNAAVEENDGYYKTGVFDSKDNANSMNGSGFEIFSTSKTTLYYQVRNVCYEFEGREPNCEKSDTKIVSNNKIAINKNLKKPDEIIRENIKLFLKEENHISFPGLTANIESIKINDNILEFVTEVIDKLPQYTCFNTKTLCTYTVPLKHLVLEKIEKDIYGAGVNKVLNIKTNENIKVIGIKYERNPSECSSISEDKYYTYAKGQLVSEFQFEYNFGTNDENFIELKNAIEALKNPNQNFGGSSKQSGNVQKTEVVNKNITENNPLSEEKRIEEINRNYELGTKAYNEHKFKDAEVYYQKVLDYNPNDKNSYSNLIAVKFELEREIVELANKNSSNISIYNKYLEKRSKLLKESKTLLESYLLLDNTNQDFKNSLEKINKILSDNEKINETPNLITPQELLNTLKTKTANKLEIFKNYFIQEGYEFIEEGNCTSFMETGILKCIKFSNFSIYQNKKGMCGITFSNNEELMNEIKKKLSSIDACFIGNEFHDKDKVDYVITFNQGKLLFYMK